MRCLILILCLVSLKVEASDWLNRTIRVDLIVNHISVRSFDPKLDTLVFSETILSGVNATNGQYPWTIFTIAWSDPPSSPRIGIPCAGSIINNNFAVSDRTCAGEVSFHSIEAFIGFARWNFLETAPTDFVRSYWYIEPSQVNRPNIVLFRFNRTITYNPNVHPIRLPFYQDFDYEGWSALSLGFPVSVTPQLQSLTANVLNNNVCILDFELADHEVCANDSGEPFPPGPITRRNAFTGGSLMVFEYADAGLVFVPVLVGIQQVQFANQTASFVRATRVSHFVEWIETISAEN